MQEKIPIAEQRYIFNGKQLNDELTLSEQQVKNGDNSITSPTCATPLLNKADILHTN